MSEDSEKESQRKMRTGRPNIRITVESVANGCSIGLKEGETWLITNRTPGGMCLAAYGMLYPYVRTLRYGGGGERKYSRVSCPDSSHNVVYKVEPVPAELDNDPCQL